MANAFCPLKENHLTGLVAESLPIGKGSCCVMAFQEMEWASMDEVNAEDFDLSNITDDEIENEFGTPDFATDEVVPIRSAEIED